MEPLIASDDPWLAAIYLKNLGIYSIDSIRVAGVPREIMEGVIYLSLFKIVRAWLMVAPFIAEVMLKILLV